LPSASPSVSSPPSIYTAIPKDVLLVRDSEFCVEEEAWPRFKCTIKQTTTYNGAGPSGDDTVFISGKDGCVIGIQPIAWAWNGRAFYFKSKETLETIDSCFVPETRLVELKSPSAVPSIIPSKSPLPSAPPSISLSVSPSMVPTFDRSCPPNKLKMLIEIKTDKNVKKDKTKWKVLKRRKNNSGKFKAISGLSGSLKDHKNTVVEYEGGCLDTSECYKVELAEAKNMKNPGMTGYLKVTFGDKSLQKDNWNAGRKFSVKIGKCEVV